ncbi:hypothetical protein DFJ77DRAFT_522293 [Powellomyces hirtus]|nr:hypothetical protein DFJ77DRAFT_522293 [Powellomyces hirtus]
MASNLHLEFVERINQYSSRSFIVGATNSQTVVPSASNSAYLPVALFLAPVERGMFTRVLSISVEGCKVFINGKWVGTHAYPRGRKRAAQFDRWGSPLPSSSRGRKWASAIGRLHTAGFIFHPKPNSGDCRWQQLFLNGFIEYLVVEEQKTAMIAMSPGDVLSKRKKQKQQTPKGTIISTDSEIPNASSMRYTHPEIHPSMLLGLLSATQPMGRIKFREMPAWQNAIVAIECYSGYNQEDSVIMNQSAIDRGIFWSMYYRTMLETERKSSVKGDSIQKPLKEVTDKGRHADGYENMKDDGLLPPGIKVRIAIIASHRRPIEFDGDCVNIAAAAGHLHIIQWLSRYEASTFTETTMDDAASMGHPSIDESSPIAKMEGQGRRCAQAAESSAQLGFMFVWRSSGGINHLRQTLYLRQTCVGNAGSVTRNYS